MLPSIACMLMDVAIIGKVLMGQLAKTVASVPPSRPTLYQVLTEQFAIAGGVCATKPLLKYG